MMDDHMDLGVDRRDLARHTYGPMYAQRYEDTWQNADVWAPEAVHHVTTLGELLVGVDRWLDVGCGTGYFLSQFPGVARAGIDLSPAMLERARANNPDALFFREGDISVDVPEWHDEWDLVTSTGQAWGYLATMAEIAQVARNMAGWTAPGGTLMLQAPDLMDLTGLRIPYHFAPERPPANTNVITAAVWTCYEEDVIHQNLIWPSLDQWVQWLAPHFEAIDLFRWPHDPPPPYLSVPRCVLVATGKRAPEPGAWATITYEPPPDEYVPPAGSAPVDDGGEDAEPAESQQPDDAAWASLKAHADREQARADDERVRAERAEALVAELRAAAAAVAPAAEPAPPDPAPPVAPVTSAAPVADPPTGPADLAGTARRLYHLPLADLVGRYAPWKPRFWRGVKRRIG